MIDDPNETANRKLDHLRIALKEGVDLSKSLKWFDHVHLIHNALPDASFNDVDLSWKFLGYDLTAPLLIEAMTGGHVATERINSMLAEAAQEVGIAIGVGSQRAALSDPGLVGTYRVVREKAPDVPVIANLGISHIVGPHGPENAKKAVEMIDADALAIHLNPLQELIQPEGTRDFSGSLMAIADVVRELDVPVIVKEVGSGISRGVAESLKLVGIEIVDVAGTGGTSWALIEGLRASEGSLEREASIAFASWGIPTPISIIEASSTGLMVIGSGGVRSGLDAAKSIALGAVAAGCARPFFKAVTESGVPGAIRLAESMKLQMRMAIFLTGSLTPEQLRLRAPYVLTGPLRDLTGDGQIFK